SFFFSSRRRHTRFDCDWSSDVCSSDLGDLNRAIWATISAGTITSATTATASAGDGGRLKTAALLTGDRGFESCSLQRRVSCEPRSEEHTSELQSQSNLVCRLLLEKKKA